MILVIDTNIIIDIFLKREPFFSDSYEAIKKAVVNDAICFVSASAATDIFYLLKKGLKSTEKAKVSLEMLLKLVNIADVLALDIQSALSSSMKDFEDAVVQAVALRYRADYILTHNIKDYQNTGIPAIGPKEFIMLD